MKLLNWDLYQVTINQFLENFSNQGLILTTDRIQIQMNSVQPTSQSSQQTGAYSTQSNQNITRESETPKMKAYR